MDQGDGPHWLRQTPSVSLPGKQSMSGKRTPLARRVAPVALRLGTVACAPAPLPPAGPRVVTHGVDPKVWAFLDANYAPGTWLSGNESSVIVVPIRGSATFDLAVDTLTTEVIRLDVSVNDLRVPPGEVPAGKHRTVFRVPEGAWRAGLNSLAFQGIPRGAPFCSAPAPRTSGLVLGRGR